MKILFAKIIVLLLVILFSTIPLAYSKSIKNENEFGAKQWTAANKLFRGNSVWRGSDDAYSVRIAQNKILWLFGDTLISKDPKTPLRSQKNTLMIRNSIGIQTGLNPAKAKIKFYWNRRGFNRSAKALFISPYISEKNWLWPGDCVLLPNKETLVVFFMNIKPVKTGFMFDIDGYQVAIIKNILLPPSQWNVSWVKNISNFKNLKIVLGSGGVITEDGFLYAYGYSSNKIIKGVTLARWAIKLFEKKESDLHNPQWWTGNETGWIFENQLGSKLPSVLWKGQQTEFTVNKSMCGVYTMFQAVATNGFIGNSNLEMRVAKKLTGPWSKPVKIYRNLYRDKKVPEDLMVYAGKYHPELTGSSFIFTYATNTKKIETLWNQFDIYYPRFLKIDKPDFIQMIKDRLN